MDEYTKERYEDLKEEAKDAEKSYLSAKEELEEAMKWLTKQEVAHYKASLELAVFKIQNRILE